MCSGSECFKPGPVGSDLEADQHEAPRDPAIGLTACNFAVKGFPNLDQVELSEAETSTVGCEQPDLQSEFSG